MLRHEGFDPRSFTDPPKALSFSGFEAPALLISEFAMSLLSGTELARQVWEHNPDCKVLLFSAQGMNRILGEGRPHGPALSDSHDAGAPDNNQSE